MEFGSIDRGKIGEQNSAGFVKIATIFTIEDDVSF